jgi:uncharacterized membrane protein YeaQ/YmgE (transglycosylase-associated protein family)
MFRNSYRGKAAKIRSREERVSTGMDGYWGGHYGGWKSFLCRYGPLMDILMGIGGGVVGGFAMSFAGLGGYGGGIITTLVVMVGAVLLTVLGAYFNGRRIFARQL